MGISTPLTCTVSKCLPAGSSDRWSECDVVFSWAVCLSDVAFHRLFVITGRRESGRDERGRRGKGEPSCDWRLSVTGENVCKSLC